jgi:WD40 repeat protein
MVSPKISALAFLSTLYTSLYYPMEESVSQNAKVPALVALCARKLPVSDLASLADSADAIPALQQAGGLGYLLSKKLVQKEELQHFAHDSHYIASLKLDAPTNQTVKTWVASWLLRKITLFERRTIHPTLYLVPSVRWSPDSTKLACAGSADRSIYVWNIVTNQCILKIPEVQGYRWLSCIDWSPDGTKIASTGSCNVIDVWDASNGRTCSIFVDDDHKKEEIRWSHDGQRLATAGAEGRVDIRTLTEPSENPVRLQYKVPEESIKSLSWCAGDQEIVAANGPLVCIWDTNTGTCLKALTGHTGKAINTVHCNPARNIIASGGNDHTVRIWNKESGECLQTLPFKRTIHAVCWNPAGTMLAVGSDSHCTLSIWDALTGYKIQKLIRNERVWVKSLDWSPNGKYLASSGSLDGNVAIWDVEHLAPVKQGVDNLDLSALLTLALVYHNHRDALLTHEHLVHTYNTIDPLIKDRFETEALPHAA